MLIRWVYCHFASGDWSTIYKGTKPYQNYPQKGKPSLSNCDVADVGNCTLNVANIQLEDAGSFTCLQNNADDYWSLTILGKYF